jgi:hypothetical protein
MSTLRQQITNKNADVKLKKLKKESIIYFRKRRWNDYFFSNNKLKLIEIHVNADFPNKTNEWKKNYISYKFPEYLYLNTESYKQAMILSYDQIIKYRINYIFNNIFCDYIKDYLTKFIID